MLLAQLGINNTQVMFGNFAKIGRAAGASFWIPSLKIRGFFDSQFQDSGFLDYGF